MKNFSADKEEFRNEGRPMILWRSVVSPLAGEDRKRRSQIEEKQLRNYKLTNWEDFNSILCHISRLIRIILIDMSSYNWADHK